MKTQTKVVLILGLVCITIIVLFGTTIYYFLNEYSYIDFYKRLETRERIFAKYNLEPEDLDSENLRILKNQYLEKLEKEKEYLIELTPSLLVDELATRYNFSKTFLKELIDKGKARDKRNNHFFVGLVHHKAGRTYLVIISAENYYATHHLIFLRNVLIGSVLLVMGIVVSFSFYFSKYIFDPIKQIISRVKLISTENIHLRLTTSNNANNSEINDLINTFNDLLNRIETAFETQKNFISNASHELGTPLTSIIGEADVSLLKMRTPEEYQKSLENILQQAERLDQITKSLLFLAQTGYKGNSISFERSRIDEVIWETQALIDKLNPSNKIVIDLSLLPEDPNKLKVNGNKQLLQLALANIFNNACKYSSNKQVVVFLASSDSRIIITIKDEGIGIPESELPYIYDPFFRASNTGLFEGYGIGLPLARNIILLHKGSMILNSTINKGTTVQISLPLITF